MNNKINLLVITISILIVSCSKNQIRTLNTTEPAIENNYGISTVEPVDYTFHINWEDYGPELIDKAIKENKYIILYINKLNCDDCDLMELRTFSNPEVTNLINEKFLITRFNASRHPDEAAQYLKKTTEDFPVVILLNPQGQPIVGLSKFIEPDTFCNIFNKIYSTIQES